MLRIALALALAGCLETPTGKPQTWPVEGNEVVAAIGADVDNDGATDAVIAATGDSPGIYVALGGTDLVLPTAGAPPIERFTAYHARDFTGPVALAFDDRAQQIVVVAPEGSKAGIETLSFADGALASSGVTEMQEAPAPRTALWVHAIALKGNAELAIGIDGDLFHVPAADPGKGMTRMMPPADPPTWMGSVLATDVADPAMPANRLAVVAFSDSTQRGPFPPDEDWTSIRNDAKPLLGQSTANLDGAGDEELIGYSDAEQALCAFDLAVASPAPTACTPFTGVVPTAPGATVLVGEITSTAGPDAMAVISAPSGASPITIVVLFPEVTWDGATLGFASANVGMPISGLEPPVISFLAEHEGDPSTDVVLIDKTGATACDPSSPSCR